ncbi:MAG: Bacterial regulatory protein tetR family [Hyphomicrobiales bacterium]|nr:Bacterial regulatory protein tetR family [Hyphomicrobiales bacterium]
MARELVRQGGRSARIQKEVHAATHALLARLDRSAITVPMIAEQAGVTPSTIYRRWGDLGSLLADVASETLRPVSDPDDTGSTAGDIEAFVLQYAEEMSSKVGRNLLRDVLSEAEDTAAAKCCRYTYDHLDTIAARASARGEAAVQQDLIIDRVIAPICYHILFGDREITADYCRDLLAALPATHRRPA